MSNPQNYIQAVAPRSASEVERQLDRISNLINEFGVVRGGLVDKVKLVTRETNEPHNEPHAGEADVRECLSSPLGKQLQNLAEAMELEVRCYRLIRDAIVL